MNHWLTTTIETYLAHYPPPTTPTIWEVGSRDGHDAVELAHRLAPDAITQRITCVEAIPRQARLIHRTYPQVTVHELAASDSTAAGVSFVVYEGSEGDVGSSSLTLTWKAHDHLPHHIIQVKTDTLDRLIHSQQVDIMKIDVEGHSLQVLQGFKTRIRQVRVFHIETETWTGSTKKVKAFMAAHGYRLTDEQEQYTHMPDLVFVRVGPHI